MSRRPHASFAILEILDGPWRITATTGATTQTIEAWVVTRVAGTEGVVWKTNEHLRQPAGKPIQWLAQGTTWQIVYDETVTGGTTGSHAKMALEYRGDVVPPEPGSQTVASDSATSQHNKSKFHAAGWYTITATGGPNATAYLEVSGSGNQRTEVIHFDENLSRPNSFAPNVVWTIAWRSEPGDPPDFGDLPLTQTVNVTLK